MRGLSPGHCGPLPDCPLRLEASCPGFHEPPVAGLRPWLASTFLTFSTAALFSPVATNMTLWAAFSTGSVRVTLCGGGFGESLIGATTFSRSLGRQAREDRPFCPSGVFVALGVGPAPTKHQFHSANGFSCWSFGFQVPGSQDRAFLSVQATLNLTASAGGTGMHQHAHGADALQGGAGARMIRYPQD